MLLTLNDQIIKAIDNQYFSKWGEFYLEQLIRALNQQIKPNFKDNVCFQFGGDYFNQLVDKSSDIFDTMPPPSTSISNMSTFNNRDGGCFAGHNLVKVNNNKYIQIKDLEKNMDVVTFDPFNNYSEKITKVIGLIKINYNHGKQLIKIINSNLEITNYHPIFIEENNCWEFPIDQNNMSLELVEEDCVYNVILENYHIIEVNSIKCITLGHNYHFDNLYHPYFGTYKILDDLFKNQNFKLNGFIELDEKNITRDPKTHLINCII